MVLSLGFTTKTPQLSTEVLAHMCLVPRPHVCLPSTPMFYCMTQMSSRSCITEQPPLHLNWEATISFDLAEVFNWHPVSDSVLLYDLNFNANRQKVLSSLMSSLFPLAIHFADFTYLHDLSFRPLWAMSPDNRNCLCPCRITSMLA